MNKIIRRVLTILPAVLLQLAWLALLFSWLAPWAAAINAVLSISAFIFVLYIITKQDEGTYKIIWLLLILTFPLPGALVYLIFGNKRTTKPLRKKLAEAKPLPAWPDGSAPLYEKLAAAGCGEYIRFDLGLVHQLDYYTGMVFRGYVEGAGAPVLSGGRYDNLMERFGRKAEATGFAVDADAVAACLNQTAPAAGRRLRIALTKGRIQEKTLALFERMGLDCSPVRDPGRRLILSIPNYPLDVVLVKAPDVITYVEHGVCDLGVVGKDTILEKGGSFYEVLDLGFGKCRFALAVKEGADFYGTYKTRLAASKYPNVARTFFEKKGMDVDIIKIEGSVELAPILELADGIVDIVETGATLRENGLAVVEDVAAVSARLIVNTAGMKLNKEQITDFIAKCEANLEGTV